MIAFLTRSCTTYIHVCMKHADQVSDIAYSQNIFKFCNFGARMLDRENCFNVYDDQKYGAH